MEQEEKASAEGSDSSGSDSEDTGESSDSACGISAGKSKRLQSATSKKG